MKPAEALDALQEEFDTIIHVLPELYEDPNITEFSNLSNKAVESLHNLNQEDVSTIRRHLLKDRTIDGQN